MAPSGANDEEGVVDPEDLDISKHDQVNKLRDGQYVIATGEGDGSADDADIEELRAAPPTDAAPVVTEDPPGSDAAEEASTPSDPRTALVDHLESLSTANGIVVAGRFDGDVDVHECRSDDPATVFSELSTWYASNVDETTPPADVLGILCLAGGRSIRYPIRALVDVLREEGLSPDDSIRDLLETLQDEGLVIPREDRG